MRDTVQVIVATVATAARSKPPLQQLGGDGADELIRAFFAEKRIRACALRGG